MTDAKAAWDAGLYGPAPDDLIFGDAHTHLNQYGAAELAGILPRKFPSRPGRGRQR